MWASVAAFNGSNDQIEDWSQPTIWAGNPADGVDGVNQWTAFYFSQKGTGTPSANPDLWSEVQRSSDQYMISAKFIDGVRSTWSEVTKIKGDDGTSFTIKGSDTLANIVAKPSPTIGDLWISTTEGTVNGEFVDIRDGILYTAAGWDNIGPLAGQDGIDGKSGLYISYIYRRTTTTTAPATPTGGDFDGQNETFPSNWTDNPEFVTGQITWISQAKYKDNLDGSWSRVSAWTKPTEFSIAGKYAETRYKKAATRPSTPTVAEPTDWLLNPPSATKPEVVWATTCTKHSTGELDNVWSTPQQWSALDGDTIFEEHEYSVNGVNGWHEDYVSGDIYRRSRTVTNGIPGAWSPAAHITGFTGATGNDGIDGDTIEEQYVYAPNNTGANNSGWGNDPRPQDYFRLRRTLVNGVEQSRGNWHRFRLDGEAGLGKLHSTVFVRSTTKPKTPTGGTFTDPVPSGWFDGVPSGDAKLWASSRTLTSTGADQTEWSEPAPMTSTVDFQVYYSVTGVGTPGSGDWTTNATDETVYMATRKQVDGVWEGWKKSKIKGETGDTIVEQYRYSASDNGAAPTSWNGEPRDTDLFRQSRILTNNQQTYLGSWHRWRKDGLDGAFHSYIYRTAETRPDLPTGGNYTGDPATEVIPTNWKDDPYYTEGHITYVSHTIYKSNGDGTFTKTGWSMPAEYSVKGDQGDKGEPGESGKTYYTWVRYADNAIGGGISDSPTNKIYMGVAYNREVPEELSNEVNNAALYTWHKMVGSDGSDGTNGTDGDTVFQEFQFSTNGVNWVDQEGANSAYMRIRTVTNGVPGPWGAAIVIKGETGDQGPQGNAGTDGKDAPTLYTWIKYADTESGSGLSDLPEGKKYIGIAYNNTSPVESTDPKKYTWSKTTGEDGLNGANGETIYYEFQFSVDGNSWSFTETTNSQYMRRRLVANGEAQAWGPTLRIRGDAGEDGTDGTNGTDGKDGVTYYTWVKYGTSSNGANLSDDPTGKTYMGIAYNKTSPTESTDPRQYTWTLIQGQSGTDGDTIYTEFQFSVNGTSNWHYPETTQDEYMRTRTVTNGVGASWGPAVRLRGNTGATGATGATGDKGEPGQDGVTKYTWIKYARDVYGFDMSDSPDDRPYIGISYNNDSPTESTNPSKYTWQKIQGTDGVNGNDGSTIFTQFEFSFDGTGDWHYPERDTDKFMRSRVVTNGDAAAWGPAIRLQGIDGVDGTDGTNGTNGTNGTDGITYYTWVKYADSVNGAGISNSPTNKEYIGIAYNKTSPNESNTQRITLGLLSKALMVLTVLTEPMVQMVIRSILNFSSLLQVHLIGTSQNKKGITIFVHVR